MAVGLDDDLVGADTAHLVEHADALARHVLLGAKSRIAVRDDPPCPASLLPQGGDLRRSEELVARTERTAVLVVGKLILAEEGIRAIGPFRRDDYPPVHDGVAAESRHARRTIAESALRSALPVGLLEPAVRTQVFELADAGSRSISTSAR